jgi:hypothetical protein
MIVVRHGGVGESPPSHGEVLRPREDTTAELGASKPRVQSNHSGSTEVLTRRIQSCLPASQG